MKRKNVIAVIVIAVVLVIGIILGVLFMKMFAEVKEEGRRGIEMKQNAFEARTADKPSTDTNQPADDAKTSGYNDAEFIGKEKAKEIALEKAGLKASEVSFVKVEIDREYGVVVYDVEFNSGRKEYSAEIQAENGTILEWHVEYDD